MICQMKPPQPLVQNAWMTSKAPPTIAAMPMIIAPTTENHITFPRTTMPAMMRTMPRRMRSQVGRFRRWRHG